MDYKVILGYISILIAIASYIIYFERIFTNKIKPHAFSWLIWSISVGIAFLASFIKNGGSGSWVIGLTSIACFIIFILALFKGEKKFNKFDWISLASALAAIFLWIFTKEPTFSVILITIIDLIGFIPTANKSFYKPNEESALFFSLAGFKFIIAIFAINSFSINTLLYPASLVLTNSVLALIILVRKVQFRKF
ncbi:MAG: hypothetical protein UT33_C0005G0049 [Candidatus Peregrinibacteria bacterium GW2011_GWC2_39_14]|nr:MAG: hypothetical protein US92_C0001G0049 [Candidatus Peregrinibacteria bacterium GW2011_GWA2_38_36]KKR07105.1 MAG: hypothetical protein UT33_C0005G0049 [Candidatus Peregrinibacteria bacterium GW2011_GWC2_39_14]